MALIYNGTKNELYLYKYVYSLIKPYISHLFIFYVDGFGFTTFFLSALVGYAHLRRLLRNQHPPPSPYNSVSTSLLRDVKRSNQNISKKPIYCLSK